MTALNKKTRIMTSKLTPVRNEIKKKNHICLEFVIYINENYSAKISRRAIIRQTEWRRMLTVIMIAADDVWLPLQIEIYE